MPLSSLVARRSLQAGAFAALVGVMAVTPLTQVDAQKGKPAPTNLGATLLLADTEGDLITSDGDSYANGAEGVSALVYGASGDLVVTTGTTRHLNVILGTPESVTGPAPAPGTYAARRLFVADIKGVSEIGSPQLRVARILDFPSLTNHVVGFLATHNSGEPAGGTPVCVTRDSDTAWTITTATTGCTPGGIGGLFTQENGRKGSIVITPLARYALPFAATVQLQ